MPTRIRLGTRTVRDRRAELRAAVTAMAQRPTRSSSPASCPRCAVTSTTSSRSASGSITRSGARSPVTGDVLLDVDAALSRLYHDEETQTRDRSGEPASAVVAGDRSRSRICRAAGRSSASSTASSTVTSSRRDASATRRWSTNGCPAAGRVGSSPGTPRSRTPRPAGRRSATGA